MTVMLVLCRHSFVLGRSAVRFKSSIQSTLDLYSNPPLSLSLSEDQHLQQDTLNAELRHLASTKQFSAAERLRLKIISNALHVIPHVEYANLALSCLKNQRLTGSSGNKLLDYKTWLALIPDRQTLLHSRHNTVVPPQENTPSPFTDILRELTYRTTPKYLMPYLSETGLAIASRGYLQPHIFTVARPIFAPAFSLKTPAVQEVFKMERKAIAYEEEHGLPSKPLATYLRSALVVLLLRRNWVSHAIKLVLQERDFPLNDATYQLLLSKVEHKVPENKYVNTLKFRQKRDKLNVQRDQFVV